MNRFIETASSIYDSDVKIIGVKFEPYPIAKCVIFYCDDESEKRVPVDVDHNTFIAQWSELWAWEESRKKRQDH